VDELIVFWAARLDEIEAAAKAALHGGTGCWLRSGNGDLVDADRDEMMWVIPAGKTTDEELAHIARHDPDRVLREAAAKRAILAEREQVRAKFEEFSASTDRELSGWWAGRVIEVERIIRVQAAVWSGHPGYRAEWKP
jgi:hypothetical protein